MNTGVATGLDALPTTLGNGQRRPEKADTLTGRTDRRALLIDAAEALFRERAYDEVTTAEIASRAGVAYGLIAHHFANKRGLYLASVDRAAERVRAVHESPPTGDTPAAQLRDVLTRHIAFTEENAQGFITLMHGGSGSDPRVREIVEDARWRGASLLLRALGVAEPVRPILRAALRGWTGYLDEMMLDHLDHRELPLGDLVELAVAALIASLRAAHRVDPGMGIAPELIDRLSGGVNSCVY